MTLEDEWWDIVSKARVGQGLSEIQLAHKSDISLAELHALKTGKPEQHAEEVGAIARALKLRSDQLRQIARQQWLPLPTPPLMQVETIRGDIGGYEVKGYIVHNGGEAVLIDTGYNASAMLTFLERRRLKLVGICLTHGHVDHAGGIDQILTKWPVPVYLGTGDEPLLEWSPPRDVLVTPADGRTIRVGDLVIECLTTPGHTPGGICYKLTHRGQPICFVGDTLFAGSIGRSNPATLYDTHLESVRRRVLTLTTETVLFPGHGPATTVREERAQNPFAGGT
jgi:glyoxylase-like metal-dependent hydrolase (beta-lactamase superfamily II)